MSFRPRGDSKKSPLRVPLTPVVSGALALPDDVAGYVIRVHRLRRGDRFVLFDPEAALEADAELEDVGSQPPIARVGEVRPARIQARRSVTLIQATAKGDKMDAIVRDATELGVTRFVPAIAERSVSRPSSEAGRADRYRRIAIQASRQCGRGDAPKIEAPTPLREAIERFAVTSPGASSRLVALCLDPRSGLRLRDELLALDPDVDVALIVGPEGGFADAELALCEEKGVRRVSMGPFILRTETVCAAVLGALLVLRAEGSGADEDAPR